VRQVGHLPEAHEDARSEKYTVSSYITLTGSLYVAWVSGWKNTNFRAKKNLVYKDEMVFCSFLFVCMEFIQIHIFEPISTELCARLPLRLEEVVGYVWTHHI
jgi:hypothetical protein